jgi:C1A family cysteine protease
MAVKRGPGKFGGYKGSVRKIKRYGWIPDHPDPRDHSYAVAAGVLAKIASSVDLRSQCPAVYDQGQLGSCTANAIAGAIEFEMMKQGMENVFTPSRLFIYYNERVMEGSVDSDAGAAIRDGIKSVGDQGDCPEEEWPYDVSKFADAPPQSCYDDAVQHKALLYQSIDQNLSDMKGCLATGYPFVFGFTVFSSFESQEVANTGNVPLPSPDEDQLGGHAVMAVGYDDDDKVFICRNSWGPGWGDAGYFYMPYSYLLDDNLADDFWTIRLVQ